MDRGLCPEVVGQSRRRNFYDEQSHAGTLALLTGSAGDHGKVALGTRIELRESELHLILHRVPGRVSPLTILSSQEYCNVVWFTPRRHGGHLSVDEFDLVISKEALFNKTNVLRVTHSSIRPSGELGENEAQGGHAPRIYPINRQSAG